SGCGGGGGGGASEVTDAVSAAVLAVAPELTAVEPLPSTPPPAFVPLTTLKHRDAR
ncbi:NifU family protein, partial [Streptomyces violarus]|nr:NifU family protein [Streptomyces violarus]